MVIRTYQQTRPELGRGVYVDDSAVVIGQVVLAEDVSIWPQCVVRGDVNRIHIGARSNIQDATVIHVTHDGPYTPGGSPTLIGADVTVGHQCLLHACSIGDFCLIGMGAIVMDDAVLEDEVFLAAGSLVPPGKRLRAGYLYRGSPAREVRPLSREEKEQLRYSVAHYVRLKNTYLQAD